MAYEYEFPHSNMFDSDLREILEMYFTVKSLPEKWVAFERLVSGEVTDLKNFVNKYFNNLNVQTEINNKLDAMTKDGSLSALIQPLFNAYKADINAVVAHQNSDINSLKSRMDTFTALGEGSTTGDAELIDGRTDYKGTTHTNIGAHIRDVSSQLSSEITNYHSYNSPKFSVGGAVTTTGELSNYPIDRCHSEYMLLLKGQIITMDDDYQYYILEYDINKNFVKSSGWHNGRYQIQNKGYYVILVKHESISDFTGNYPIVKITSINEYYNSVISNRGYFSVLDFGAKIDGVTDDTNAVLNAINVLKNIGGGTLLFPYTGKSLIITDTLSFDFGNVILDIRCDIDFVCEITKNLIEFKGTTTQKLCNIKIIGNKNVLKGNADIVTDYTYGQNDYSTNCLYMIYCENIYISNLTFTKGLDNCCSLSRCNNYKVDNCEFSYALHDNGYTSGANAAWTTRQNGFITNCYAHHNTDFGFCCYDAINVDFESCLAENNGSNNEYSTGKYGATGGGFAFEWVQVSEALPKLDLESKAINCVAKNNITNAFYITASGIELVNCKGCNTIKPTLKITDDSQRFGSGLFAFMAHNLSIKQCDFSNNGYHGVRFIGGDKTSNFKIDAKCNENTGGGLTINGCYTCRISGYYELNGSRGVSADNSSYNTGGGRIVVSKCESNRNKGMNFYCNHIKKVDLLSLYSVDAYYNTTESGKTNISITNADMCIIGNVVSMVFDAILAVTTGLNIADSVQESVVNSFHSNVVLYNNATTKKGIYYK